MDAIAKKWGNCQKKMMANRVIAGIDKVPVAAVQPIRGGIAPGIAPTHVLSGVRGFRKKLVEKCLSEAARLGLPKVFVLTYEMEFFKKLGFVETEKESFPEKVFTDCARCSKVNACDEKAMIYSVA